MNWNKYWIWQLINDLGCELYKYKYIYCPNCCKNRPLSVLVRWPDYPQQWPRRRSAVCLSWKQLRTNTLNCGNSWCTLIRLKQILSLCENKISILTPFTCFWGTFNCISWSSWVNRDGSSLIIWSEYGASVTWSHGCNCSKKVFYGFPVIF